VDLGRFSRWGVRCRGKIASRTGGWQGLPESGAWIGSSIGIEWGKRAVPSARYKGELFVDVLDITRVNGTRFRIENPMPVAERFFRHDPSSAYGVDRNGYDAWILAHGQDTQWFHTLIERDIHVINGSNMHMRSPLSAWASWTTGDTLPWLEAMDVQWALEMVAGEQWQRVRDRILNAISELIAKDKISIAGATKVLHMKRPYLVPILDSYVGDVLASPKPASKSKMLVWSELMLDTLHDQLRDNIEVIRTLARDLATQGLVRSPVRILDALLWSAAPESRFFRDVRLREL